MSLVGLTIGCGGDGACSTSRIACGGVLYPDGASTEVASFAVDFVCAAACSVKLQAASPASRKRERARWLFIEFLSERWTDEVSKRLCTGSDALGKTSSDPV